MRVDIYTCRFGSGHLKAAENIQDKLAVDADIEIIDLYEELFPKLSPYIYNIYSGLVKSPKKLFTYFSEKVYSDQIDQYKGCLYPIKKDFHNKLDKKRLPTVFLATYSVVAYLLGDYIRERGLNIPLVTYITDYKPHNLWLHPQTSLYLVSSLWTKELLLREGISEEKIKIYGDKSIRKEEKIKSVNHLLMTGGGLGLLPEDLQFYKALDQVDDLKVRVVCGRNKKLFSRLRKIRFNNIEVYGLVEEMEGQLEWADFFLGKPGGMSVKEAISYELPIIYLPPKLTQEKKNREFIEEAQIGCSFSEDRIHDSNYIFNNPTLLASYTRNIKEIKKSYESEAISCLFDGSLSFS